MQTLGIADSTPSTDNRLKSLFWPSITTGADVDYLGSQDYWVCTLVAVLSSVFLLFTGQPIMAALLFLYFYIGGIGVRERSTYAAVAVFVMYVLDMLLGNVGVLRILISALLLSNIRATHLANSWNPSSEEAELPPRLSTTLGDKLADQFPMWCWPKVRIVYYVYSAGFLLCILFGVSVMMMQRGVAH
jgi:hypothetical protein